jgi:hypothetical protein
MKIFSLRNYTLTAWAVLMSFMGSAQTTMTGTIQDPLKIPYQTRLEWQYKGNLVPNASFEKGADEGNSFKLNSWQLQGQGLSWIDKSSFKYSATEVFDGARSIRISRPKAGELDPSDGILSDIIEVIPGNYDFSLYMKLSNISGSGERLGTKLYDAIDIRLLYFDDQKKPIDPKMYYPYKGVYLDNSFKGYSFSNYWHIDEFNWGMVIGRTYNYPFSEGDIPVGTKFVKIFLGLKGTGTMWVDKVDLHYSKWNFTPMERIEPYSDKEYSLIEMLVPTPQSIKNINISRWYDKTAPSRIPVILMPAKPEKQTAIAGELLKGQLELRMKNILGKAYKKEMVIVTSRLTDSLSKTASMIFSIGNNELCLRYSDSILAKVAEGDDQAYFIKNVAGRILFLKGNGAMGDYYAVTTAVQLIGEKDFTIESATIVDRPDFTGRSLLLAAWNTQIEAKEDVANLDRMVKWKLNKVYVGYGQPNKEWFSPTDVYKYGVGAAGSFCKKTGLMKMAIMINPYYHFNYEMNVDSLSDKLRYTWTHGDPNSISVLKSSFELGLDSGASCIMLMSDDFVPHEGDSPKNYSLYTPEDKSQFVNLQNAQASVINSIYKWLAEDYPGTRFEFCPPWYLNEFIDKSHGKAEQYFSDLKAMIPKEVAIVWTGNTVRSLSMDMADIFRYKQLIGRYPMLWDNTLYARSLSGNYGGYPAYYPDKIRLCNIFEPLDISVPANFSQYNDGPGMYVNGDAASDCYKIKFMTVADFEWNNAAYNADFSLWKALYKTYGKENALKLLTFNDDYYALMQLIARIDAGQGTEKDNKTAGDALVKDLTAVFSDLAKVLEVEKKLILELKTDKDDLLLNYKSALEKAHQKGKIK